jgi:hypothetical protein
MNKGRRVCRWHVSEISYGDEQTARLRPARISKEDDDKTMTCGQKLKRGSS